MFKAMIREISELAKAMGIPFEQDYVAINLDILSALPTETTTSMQRDVMAHKPSELEGLVFEVVTYWVKNTMFLFRCMKRSLKN